MRSWHGTVRCLIGGIVIGLLCRAILPVQAAEPPTNYDEARQRAQRAWDQLQSQDPKTEEAAQLRAEALRDFRFALAHPPRGVKIDDLNAIRYSLAYLYWATQQYYEAAVVGEFLARCYPDSSEAPQGAKIALAAYATLLTHAPPGNDRKFDSDRMTSLAQFIAERWPQSPTADEAWLMLLHVAVSNRDVDKTVECLGHVSTDSPLRGETELAAGQALWAAYLDAARLAEPKRPATAEMTKMLAQARSVLEDGVGRVRKSVDAGGEVSYSLAAAALSLAQICLESGQAEKAIQWLDDPAIGPGTLVKADSKLVGRGNFRLETLKAALRAYVATQQMDRVEETVTALEKTNGGANLGRIYLSLGLQMEDSLKRVRAEGNSEEAAKVVRGFAAFLARLSARPAKETSFSIMNWAAETLDRAGHELGPGRRQSVVRGGRLLSEGGRRLPQDARCVPRRRALRPAAGGHLHHRDPAGPLPAPAGQIPSGHRRFGRGVESPEQHDRGPA